MPRTGGPMTDDEIERAKEELAALRREVRQVLADELETDPGECRAGRVEAVRAVVYDDGGGVDSAGGTR